MLTKIITTGSYPQVTSRRAVVASVSVFFNFKSCLIFKVKLKQNVFSEQNIKDNILV